MTFQISGHVLILAYPGQGIRTLIRKDKAYYHLDQIGYFVGGNYYKWFVSVDVFRQKWRVFSTPTKFIGYGQNWRALVDVAGQKHTCYWALAPEEYERRVAAYRETAEYREIDLKKHLKGRPDHPIGFYLKGYQIWLKEVSSYGIQPWVHK
jgi:hypothetical protein